MKADTSPEFKKFIHYYPRVILLGILLGIATSMVEPFNNQDKRLEFPTYNYSYIADYGFHHGFQSFRFILPEEGPSFFASKTHLLYPESPQSLYEINPPLNWQFLNGRMHLGTMYSSSSCFGLN